MSEQTYDELLAANFVEVKEAFDVALSKLKAFTDEFGVWDYDDKQFKNKVLKALFVDANFKLNCYSYDDRTYHCGSSDGHYSYLISPLSEEEIKEHMREFFDKNPNDFCMHKFLASMSEYGHHMTSYESIDFNSSNILDYEVNFNGLKEKDILSAEKYSEIVAAREKEEKEKREAQARQAQVRLEAQEKEQLARLKRKYE